MNSTLYVYFVIFLAINGVFGAKPKLNITLSNIQSNENPKPQDNQYLNKSESISKNKEIYTKERVVTDLQVIYGNQGVSINYHYNETGKNNQTKSAPGCPKSIEGFPWIYYGNPPRCFLAGHYGPCGYRQKLVKKDSSNYGICVCECLVNDIDKGKVDWDSFNGTRFVKCDDYGVDPSEYGLIFDTVNNTCYELRTQGPCGDGEVLTGSNSISFECFPSCVVDEELTGYRVGDKCTGLVTSRITSKYIQSNKCREDEKYSDILKRCIEKEEEFIFN